MNMKLKKVLDEIQKTEERITEWQEHLRELNIRKKQLEDAEIIKSIRSLTLNSRELLVVLDKIQNGTAVFPYLTEETTVPDTKKEEDWKDIAEERKLPGHRAEEKEDEHRENETEKVAGSVYSGGRDGLACHDCLCLYG